MIVKETISVYSNHLNIQKIKKLCIPGNKFDLPHARSSDINKIIKSLNINKAKGPDGISAIDCHLGNIINNDISLNKYLKHAKAATVRPIFKKDDGAKIKNSRPVSLLNIFSKISKIYSWLQISCKSHKLRRHIFSKIYFRLLQVL